MATYTGQRVKDTYESILKLKDNEALTSAEKVVTDGLGNKTPLSVSTNLVKATSDVEAQGFRTPSGTPSQFLKADGSTDSTAYITASDVVPSQWDDLLIGGINYAGGNVGIGTTNPTEKLEVVGDIVSQGIYVDRTHEFAGISNPFAKLGLHYFWGDSNNINLQKTGNNNKFTFSTQTGYLQINNSSGAALQIKSSDQSVKSVSGTFNLGVAQHGAANNNQGNYVSITNGGNTTGSRGVINVNGDLKINDYSTSSAIEKIKLKNDGSAYFAGNVGIGTTNPLAKLDIVGSPSSDSAPLTSVSLAGKTASGTGWAGTSVLTGYTHSTGNIDPLITNIVPSANTKYLITFTISGITSGRYERIFFGGVQYNIYVSQNLTRTIAIKTANTDPLEVIVQSGANGTISIDSISSVGSRDSVINTRNSNGSIFNEIRNGHSQSSLYIGYKSGESITSALTSNNVAIGYQTLKDNMSGTANTIIGYNSLSKAFATSYMTTLGYNLFPNYSNSGNVYSIAIGTNIATSSQMTGGSNILIGNNMFMSATTANGNVAMGYNSMRDVTTGSKNIALGGASLFSNTSGTGNVGLGEYSLANKTSGNYNVAIGLYAARYLGGSSTPNTNSSNSIFLGYKAGPNGDSQTNQIVIGHEAIGNGSNSATIGSTTITKTILNGNVGIGTTSPSEKLYVAGSIGLNTGQSVKWGIGATKITGIDGSFISFTPNNSEKVRFLANGNVGIGTTSPSEKLHVDGGSISVTNTGNAYLSLERASGAEVIALSQSTLGAIGTTSNHRFDIRSNGGSRASFLTNGNVGIGTTSPSQKLEVDGEVLSDGYRLSAMQTAPASRNSTGTLGEIRMTSDYMYVCYATNSWNRVHLHTSWG